MTDQIDFDNFNPDEWELGDRLTPEEAISELSRGSLVMDTSGGTDRPACIRLVPGAGVSFWAAFKGRWVSYSTNLCHVYRAVRKRVPLTPEQLGERLAEQGSSYSRLVESADGNPVVLAVLDGSAGGFRFLYPGEEKRLFLRDHGKENPKPRRKLDLGDTLKWMAENPGKVAWACEPYKGEYRWNQERPEGARLELKIRGKWERSEGFKSTVFQPVFYLDPPEEEGEG